MQSESEVTVIRSSCTLKMSSNKLVPGDLLVLNKPCSLNCDLVLLEGTCTVNESMLTGECVPIAKTSLRLDADATYSPRTNKKVGTKQPLSENLANMAHFSFSRTRCIVVPKYYKYRRRILATMRRRSSSEPDTLRQKANWSERFCFQRKRTRC